MSSKRPLLPYFLVPALPLLIPLVAMRFTEEVKWTGSDFAIAYILFAGAGFAYRLATGQATSATYRIAVALAVFAGLTLIWVNLAVGFIGDEDNPANLLYGGVIALGVLGSLAVRFEPAGMFRVLFVVAVAQFLVPIIAWLVWRPNFDDNVVKIFVLNALWVFMFLISAQLFRNAAAVAPASAARQA